MPVIGPHPLLGFLTPPLDALAELACDLRWSWNHATDALWDALEPTVWQRTRNPVLVLQNASRRRLEVLARDPAFVERVAQAAAARREYLARPSWFERQYPDHRAILIAYFSMEYGITDALPLYSGGLGALAGDHLKAASDLGVPLVAVGLFFRQGYFRQVLDSNGWQRELYPNNSPSAMPVRPVLDDDGTPLRVTIPLPGRDLLLRAWHACVGRVSLYLIDSDDPLNSPADRGITSQLYGGDRETRFVQEIALGIGGWRLLQALGFAADVCHLNEGHAAFVTVERARGFKAAHGVTFWEALWATRAGNVFTTHTPLEAAFDTFPQALLARYGGGVFRDYLAELGLDEAQLIGLGRRDPGDAAEPYNMAYHAARTCARMNGVSRLHGEVSRRIFAPLYPRWPEDEIPVTHITNGVHVPSWDSPAADGAWTDACGKERWLGSPDGLAAGIAGLDDATLWSLRGQERRDLVEYAQRRLALQLGHRGADPAAIEAARDSLDPNVLTIGFARRFTEYKRPNLLLQDTDRLLRLLNDPVRPVQIIVAGKAHPHDEPGKRALQRWAGFASLTDARTRTVLLEDYDLALAKQLVQGVDVWLNTPRRPWEASGTSGMKVLVNGGLNLSSLDGWWAEAWTPEVGWAVGDEAGAVSSGNDDEEAAELYRLLEDEIVPCFYDRDVSGIPRAWVARIRASMSRLTPSFSTNRMLAEYVQRMYLPAAADFASRARDGARTARSLCQWMRALEHHWREIHWGRYDVQPVNEGLEVTLQVYLGHLPADSVSVQLFAERHGGLPVECHALSQGDALPGAVSGFVYRGLVRTERPARDFAPRVVPSQETVTAPAEAPLIRWYPD
jgi:starch phosphorylase